MVLADHSSVNGLVQAEKEAERQEMKRAAERAAERVMAAAQVPMSTSPPRGEPGYAPHGDASSGKQYSLEPCCDVQPNCYHMIESNRHDLKPEGAETAMDISRLVRQAIMSTIVAPNFVSYMF